MKKSTKIILIVVIMVLIIAMRYHSMRITTPTPPPLDLPMGAYEKPATTTPLGEPTFTWTYREFDAEFDVKSDITLTATYPDGTKHSRMIETIEGGCNEYSSPDKDVYAKSKMIMCYYAGFGRYYKVVKDDAGYAVMRKEFEEGSPDYNPPVQVFKEVNRF